MIIVGQSFENRLNYLVDRRFNDASNKRHSKYVVFTDLGNYNIVNDRFNVFYKEKLEGESKEHKDFLEYLKSLKLEMESRQTERNSNKILFNRNIENGKTKTLYIVIDDFISKASILDDMTVNDNSSLFREFFDNLSKYDEVGIKVILSNNSYDISEVDEARFKIKNFEEKDYLGGLSPEEEEKLFGLPVYLGKTNNEIIRKKYGRAMERIANHLVIKKDEHSRIVIDYLLKIRNGDFDSDYGKIKYLNLNDPLLKRACYKDVKISKATFENLSTLYSIAIGSYIVDVLKEKIASKKDFKKSEIIDYIKSSELEKDDNLFKRLSYSMFKFQKPKSLSKNYSDYLKNKFDNDLSILLDNYYNEIIRFESCNISKKTITSITLKNLFNYRNYKITIPEKDITFLFATNGFGKTTVLNLIDKALNSKKDISENLTNLQYIQSVIFDYFEIIFNDGSVFSINKNDGSGMLFKYSNDTINVSINMPDLFKMNDPTIDGNVANVDNDIYKKITKHYYYINRFFQGNVSFIPLNDDSISKDFFDSLVEEEDLTPQSLYNKYKEFRSNSFGKELFLKISDLCERLFSLSLSAPIFEAEHAAFDTVASIHLSPNLFKKFNDMKEASFFPIEFTSRYKFDEKFHPLTEEDARKHNLECSSPATLKKEFDFNNLSEFDSYALIIDELYALYEQYVYFKKEFEEIYDDYNPTKKEVIIQNGAIKFRNKTLGDSSIIKPTSLSSGEINVAKILFKVVMNEKNTAILLLDEPEVSLHIAWQDKLMSIIPSIIRKNNKCQLIIATHSPFIGDGYNESQCEVELL